MSKGGAGADAEVDGGAGPLGQFLVAGDEVGVQVGLDDVGDTQAQPRGGVEIHLDVALGIDHGGDTFRTNQIGSVGQAASSLPLSSLPPAWPEFSLQPS